MGGSFRGFLIRYPLRPADLLASLADLTGLSPSHRRLLHPSFQRVSYPSRCRVWLRWQLSKLHRRPRTHWNVK